MRFRNELSSLAEVSLYIMCLPSVSVSTADLVTLKFQAYEHPPLAWRPHPVGPSASSSAVQKRSNVLYLEKKKCHEWKMCEDVTWICVAEDMCKWMALKDTVKDPGVPFHSNHLRDNWSYLYPAKAIICGCGASFQIAGRFHCVYFLRPAVL